MNFKNLLTLSIDTNLISSNLQASLNYLQQKINQISHGQQQMQHKIMALDLASQNSIKRNDKIQKFTFDNFRLAFNQLVTLKSDIDTHLKKEPTDINLKKSNLATIFQEEIGTFSKETKVLHKRVSELQLDVIKAIAINQQQTKKVKKEVEKYNQEISGIRNSITNKFQEYQKSSQSKNQQIKSKINAIATTLDKNQKQFNNRISKILQERLQKFPQHKKITKSKKQILFQLKKQMQEKSESQSSVHSKKQIDQEVFQTSKIIQKSKSKKSIHANGCDFDENQQRQNFRRQYLENQQRLINQLKQSLFKNLNQRLIEFQAKLQDLSNQSQKKDMQILQLKKSSSSILQSQSVIIEKLNDSKNQINNLKNSIYEFHQKHNHHSKILLENQSRFISIQNFFKDLNSKVTQKFMEMDFQTDSRKFKPIQNVQNKNNLVKINGAKTAYSSVHGDESHVQGRLSNLNERLLKMQQKLKIGSGSSLPRIDSNKNITSSNRSSQSSLDLVKKQLQKVNEQLNKTNERVGTLKKNLKQLYQSHNQIPKKFQQIDRKIRQKNDLQQDRLLQLIKQLINRCLTDPFNNNFTNTLKRQINIKFLQIKHEYSSIWKDIQLRVADRAQGSQLVKLKEVIESVGLQLKSMINKKAENEDLKKGIKYMDAKIKEIYIQFKNQEATQSKKYFMGKK